MIMNGALQPEVGKRRDEQRVKKLVIKTLFILAIAKKICVLMLWQSQNLGLKKIIDSNGCFGKSRTCGAVDWEYKKLIVYVK